MADLITKSVKNIWHPFTQMKTADRPLVIKRGQGAIIYDESGNEFIDAIASWWVNLHGHCHPKLTGALVEQAKTLEHVLFAGFTHEPAILLSERILSLLPNMEKLFFSDNGSTSVEVGLKMVLQYWHNLGHAKTGIVSFEGAYHGDTFGAMSVGDGGVFNRPFVPLMFDCERIPFPSDSNIERVQNQFHSICMKKSIAAFIFEPLVQGVAGFRMCRPQHLQSLIDIAHEYGVLCIADEVMTGFGRTGKLFASLYLDRGPDIVCIAKGITGGTMPLAATCCTQEIFEAFLSDDVAKTFFHGHSYTANPLGCSVANASLDILLGEDSRANRQRIARRFESEVERFNHYKLVKKARAMGSIFAIELETGKTSYFNEIGKKVGPYFQSRGIILRPLGNVLYVLPPYCITDIQLDHVLQTMENFINESL